MYTADMPLNKALHPKLLNVYRCVYVCVSDMNVKQNVCQKGHPCSVDFPQIKGSVCLLWSTSNLRSVTNFFP